jgi:hypothetical protein
VVVPRNIFDDGSNSALGSGWAVLMTPIFGVRVVETTVSS